MRDLQGDIIVNARASPRTDLESCSSSDFEAFYRSELDWARRLAFLLTADAGHAEDIAQEAFLRLQRRLPRLKNPRAYLRVTLINLCRRHRGRAAQKVITAAAVTESDQIPTSSLEILDVIDRLPLRQRAVIVLRYFDDLSEKEIATVLRCRPGTVKSLAARALQRLRKELDDE